MNRTVVVCEEEGAALLTRQVLEAEGYTVVTTSRREDVAALATVHLPWLLVLGQQIVPLDTVGELREQLPDPDTAILCVTVKVNGAIGGYGRGADMYLTKPLNPRELMMFIRRLRVAMGDEPPTTPPPAVAPTPHGEK